MSVQASNLPPARRRDLAAPCRHPAHFYIDTGNLCNLRCPFCITGAKQTTQPTGLMSLANYQVIFEKIKHSARLISLYNWGEPLLNPDLLDIIATTSSSRIRTHIDTNFSIRDLTVKDAEALVDSGLSSLFVSLDGASQAGYEAYRVRGRFDRVLRNLRLMADTKRQLQSATPSLGWQFHVHRYNEADMDAARQMSEDIGVPIVFKRLSTPDPAWKSSYHGSDEMFIGPRAWFWQVYTPPPNPDMATVSLHPDVLPHCRQLFETMVVEWNGDVYPCTVVSSPRHVMGNLLTQSLDKVWNGPQFVQSRQFIGSFGPRQNGPSVCENQRCAMVRKCSA